MNVIVCGYEHEQIFRRVWMRFMEELYDAGGEVVPTKQNLDQYVAIYMMYVSGEAEGYTLLLQGDDGKIIAANMGGEIPIAEPTETNWGRVARCWGIWVDPEHRRSDLSINLDKTMGRMLLADGFDTIVSDVHFFNKIAFKRAVERVGYVPHLISGYLDLRKLDETSRRS